MIANIISLNKIPQPGKYYCVVTLHDGIEEKVVQYIGENRVKQDDGKIRELDGNDQLAELMVVTSEGKEYPLKFSQWENAIKAGEVDTGKQVYIHLQPFSFLRGNIMKKCSGCDATFVSAAEQLYCPLCCMNNEVAKVIPESPYTVPKKRARLVPESKVKETAEAAWHEARRKHYKTFEEFYAMYSYQNNDSK
jgi:hypothetical protein